MHRHSHGWRSALVLAAAAAIGAGCGGDSSRKDASTLTYQVVSDSGDIGARRKLAIRAQEEGRPGAALRELLWLNEGGALGGRERDLLGLLLLSRGEARLDLGDAGAKSDLRLASRLGVGVLPESSSESSALCAVAALRHSSEFQNAKAARCLAGVAASSPYHRYHDGAGLALDDIQSLWDWFATAGAKRRALAMAQAYVDGGGRDAVRLDAWRNLHHWWYGSRRPLLPVDAAQAVGAGKGPLQRFVDTLAALGNRPEASPEGLALDWGVPELAPGLAGVLAGYRRDPALGDRRAREFADQSAYLAPRAALLCELFYRLGDMGRTRSWSQKLVDNAPGIPASHTAAGLGHAVDRDPGRANMFLTSGAAASGDAGATWLLAALAYRRTDSPLQAVAAGRKAMSLTARGWDMHILLEVSLAQDALERGTQAEKTREALWSRLPMADRQAARRAAADYGNDKGAGTLKSLLDPLRHHFGFSPATAR